MTGRSQAPILPCAEAVVRKAIPLLSALGFLSLSPLRAGAQWPVSFGVAAGPTFSSDAQGTGYHVGGLIGLDAVVLPIGFRVDAVMNQFNVTGGKTRIFDVTGNVMYSMIPTPLVKPYLIGGLGFYSSHIVGSSDLGSNDIGVNVGAGAKLSLIALNGFVDARYHHVFTSGKATSFIPVSIGITF